MSERGEVLVVIMNNSLDFSILHEKLWYRIPVSSKVKWIKDRWPPRWLAFYQTKEFKQDAHAVNYFGRVLDIQEVYRWQLFPNEPEDQKSLQKYFRIHLASLERLQKPILSRRWRRIIFIPTTWQKFSSAEEINDLYEESNLEESLWNEFKQRKIWAERQEHLVINRHHYFLDFAIYCAKGNLDIETDGDFWHANPQKAEEDNVRENELKTSGWQVLRFGTSQIQEQMAEYCLPIIVKNINNLGGVDEGKTIPRKIDLDASPGTYQPSLFD